MHDCKMCFKEKMTAYLSIKRRCCCCSAKVKKSSISWAEGIFLRIKFLLLWVVVFNSVCLVAEPGLTISSTSLTRLQGVLSLVLLIIHIHNYQLQDHMQVMSERKKRTRNSAETTTNSYLPTPDLPPPQQQTKCSLKNRVYREDSVYAIK